MGGASSSTSRHSRWKAIHKEHSSDRKIYLLQKNGTLQSLSGQPYSSEDLLQTLLEKYPDLLAGEQINESAPRRWLLVSREVGVPGEEGVTTSGPWITYSLTRTRFLLW